VWSKNLLFLAVVVGGFVLLTGSLRPLREARKPTVVPKAALANDEEATVHHLNAVFQVEWRARSIQPAAAANDLAVMRRLHLALMGTVPSLQEIRLFESMPPENRMQSWLEHLLEDRRCADYMGERLARAYVGTEDGPFIQYRRRRFVSWLSDELANQRPYDQMVRSLIAEDGLWTEKPATNFVTVTFEEDKKGFNPERLASRVARAFLGVRLDCAQCHDHPFQSWKQKDFLGLAAYFAQTQRGFTGLYEDSSAQFEVDKRRNGQVETIEPCVPLAEIPVPTTGTRRQQLAAWVTDERNVWFARATVNRIWALLFGKPLVSPVDDIPVSGDVPEALTILADDFAHHGFDLRRLIRIISATEVFQLDSALAEGITSDHEETWAVFPLTRLRPEQVVGGIYQTGSLQTLDRSSPVFWRFLSFVGEKDFVRRYGDTGEDEFNGKGGTIPQRLLMMNGELVADKTNESPLNAPRRIAVLAPDDRKAVETAYLAVLTRRPTSAEAAHFEARLAGTHDAARNERVGDLCWTLINSTEFSWNH
jgi:hypothetical protein